MTAMSQASTHGKLTPHLERLRTWRSYSLRDLAEASGVAVRTIWGGEHDQRLSARSVRRLADALGVEPDELTREEWGA
jgi:transcriptional regulator with XRE-family HTH domain